MRRSFKGNGVKFGKAKDDVQKKSDYVDRARAEEKRFDIATDSEFWLCFCFFSDGEKLTFLDRLMLPDELYISGASFRAATESVRPESVKRTFPRKPKSSARVKNPLEGIEPTDDLEADCLREAHAVIDAITGAVRPDPLKEVTDSDIYFIVVFASREDKESYLKEMNLARYGDKYMDGSSWLKELS